MSREMFKAIPKPKTPVLVMKLLAVMGLILSFLFAASGLGIIDAGLVTVALINGLVVLFISAVILADTIIEHGRKWDMTELIMVAISVIGILAGITIAGWAALLPSDFLVAVSTILHVALFVGAFLALFTSGINKAISNAVRGRR
jgi:hypothetical protein